MVEFFYIRINRYNTFNIGIEIGRRELIFLLGPYVICIRQNRGGLLGYPPNPWSLTGIKYYYFGGNHDHPDSI